MNERLMKQVYDTLLVKSKAGYTSVEEENLLKVLSPDNSKSYKDTFFEENPDMVIIFRSLIK